MNVFRTAASLLILAALASAACAADADKPAAAPEKPAAAPVATNDDVAKLLDRVEAVRQTIKELEADVRYTRVVEVLEIEEAYKGTMLFQMPRFLRMELKEDDGDKRRIYIVGKKYAWIYHPDKKLAERYYMGEAGGDNLVEMKQAPNPFEYGLTHGLGKLRETFLMRIAGSEKIDGREATILELRPKPEYIPEGDKGGVKLMFWIDDKMSVPIRVREFKSRGQEVDTYTLGDVKLNPRHLLPRFGDPFEFDPPKDVVVEPFNEPKQDEGKPAAE